jgi:hypothetical protein
MKRGMNSFLVIAIIVIFFISFLSNQVLGDDMQQLKKTYSWLQIQSISKWSDLDIMKHVFSLLALEDKLTFNQVNASIKSLMSKSFDNGTCWGINTASNEQSCNLVNTAMVKFALDSLQDNHGTSTGKVSDWLLSKTNVFLPSNAVWYLQIIQTPGQEIICNIDYNNHVYEFTIDSKSKIHSNDLGSCFNIAEQYWLGLKNEDDCPKKTYNITCNESVSANFLFSRINSRNEKEWYVTGQLVTMNQGETQGINLTSLCISSQGSCDYEATLWAAYAFSIKEPDKATIFLPYLLMQEQENKGLLPAAFLYKITGNEDFADEITSLQGQDGLILADNPVYYKYYDTAIAQITGSTKNIDISNQSKMTEKLLTLEKRDGNYYYWDPSSPTGFGEDKIKDTAMLLYAFWPGLWAYDCEKQGLTCVNNCSASNGLPVNLDCGAKECCNLSSYDCESRQGSCKSTCFDNETQVNYGCSYGICCKPNILSSCSELHGQWCPTEDCVNNGLIIPKITSSEGPYCCIGNCTTSREHCGDLNGTICTLDYGSCQGGFIDAIEDFCCPADMCVQGQLTCQQKYGSVCLTDEVCNGGILVNASDTYDMATCCISGGTCMKSTCQATRCLDNELCVGGNGYQTADALLCCEGTCLKTCDTLGGDPCDSDMTCQGSIERSSDFSRCCIGTCKNQSKFPWIILVIIFIVIIIIILFFFLIKSGKIKFKNKSDEEVGENNFPDFGFPSSDINIKPKPEAPKAFFKEKEQGKKVPSVPVKKDFAKEFLEKKKKKDEDVFEELNKIN